MIRKSSGLAHCWMVRNNGKECHSNKTAYDVSVRMDASRIIEEQTLGITGCMYVNTFIKKVDQIIDNDPKIVLYLLGGLLMRAWKYDRY
jgi:hypothetical protein